MARPLAAHPAGRLAGTAPVPGDKSISHRALMLGALAVGESRITGLLEGADVRATAEALGALGVRIRREPDSAAADGPVWHVSGAGVGTLTEPACVLDMGNSGTSARLLSGILATCPFTSFVTGDASLVKRPMNRVVEPLQRFGAGVVTRSEGRLPMAVCGAREPVPTHYELPVASAQVKSAVLLAGLNAPGTTTVVEPAPTRDHTETMLAHFGADVAVEGNTIQVTGEAELGPRAIAVPADPSSAAYPLVAALLAPDGEVTVPGVALSPRRDGLYRTLAEMGADLVRANPRRLGGEPVADLTARPSRLQGVRVPAERAPSTIDEYPILAVAAALAEGTTVMEGVGELRVKESDRIAGVAEGLAACGVHVEAGRDWLAVTGTGGKPPAGGATVATHLDHRLAMAFLVLGGACRAPVTVDDGDVAGTSFPGFAALLAGIGARLVEPGAQG